MNISSISSQNFGVVLMIPPQVNVPPAAIVRSVDRLQGKYAQSGFHKFSLHSLPARQNGHAGDMFILHEAVLPDTKIRVVGVPEKSAKPIYPAAKLKGPGRKHIKSIWQHK